MPIISIPTTPGYVRATPEFVDNSVTLQPPLGGVTQRIERLGSRWALSVEMPPMIEGSAAFLNLTTALLQARREGGSYPWPQPGVTVGTPGSPVVNGGGQSGSTLICTGFTPGYTVRAGQFIGLGAFGRWYLHQITAPGTATGGGNLTLSIFPMLRVSPLNTSPLNMTPNIEGNVDGNFGYTHEIHPWVPLQFRIAEVA